MVQTPKIAIILINWNNSKDTIECLETLSRTELPCSIDVYLVDNGSKKEDLDNLINSPYFSIIKHLLRNEENLGYVVASNIAIKKALEDKSITHILQLDNDTTVSRYTLVNLIKVMESDNKIGIVGAKIFYYNEPTRLQWVGEDQNLWLGEVVGLTSSFKRIFTKESIVEDKYNKVRDVSFIVSWCSLTKVEVFNKIGLLDEAFFFGWEDNDFCLRARKAGYRLVFNPEATLYHKYSSAFALDGHLQYHGPKTRFRFMRKHASKPQLVFFYLYYFLIHFWLATAYYLLWVRKPSIYIKFLKGTIEGALNVPKNSR